MIESPEPGVRPVKSATHTVVVLEFLASRNDRPAKLREIADATEIPRSSLYALLRTLAELGWVQRDATGTLYRVGIRALIAGMSYLDSDPQLIAAKPILDRLHEELDETVHLGRLDGTEVVYLATRESSQYLRAINRVGRRLPASATSLGKAMLAALPSGSVDSHLTDPLPRLTEHTVTDRERLFEELGLVRERGYALDVEENTAGLKCFGVVIPSATGPLDAISCSVPLARLTPDREERIVETMLRAVSESITPRTEPGGAARP